MADAAVSPNPYCLRIGEISSGGASRTRTETLHINCEEVLETLKSFG
jgi:hypothetical protein